MNKLDLESRQIVSENISKIKELFPNVVTEGEDGLVINFDLLKQELSNDIVEGIKERYQLTWPGKNEAIISANTPTNNTLRPLKEKSKNFDTTKNVYIEGDNLEVLKLLQESYLNKIKCIYIDPPYNTGKDFIYKDKFSKDKEQELIESGQIDDLGNRFVTNSDSSGKYHSDWLSMMYPRLKLARNLLTEDGVIFISIDDKESHNLRKIADEIFGEGNFIVEIINITGASQNGEGVKFQKNTESCLVYSKIFDYYNPIKLDKAAESLRNLNDSPTALNTRPEMGYSIYYNDRTKEIIPLKDYDKNLINTNDESIVYSDDNSLLQNGFIPLRPGKRNGLLNRWRWGFDTFIERKDEIIIKESNGKFSVYFKQTGYNPSKNIMNFTVGTTIFKDLFDGKKIFDYSKNPNMLKYILATSTVNNDIVLDFFSGSATTAHAVMQLNAEDGGNRRFIMVQLPEVCDEKSEAFKAGYKNICEIGQERIRRAGNKVQEENPNANIDTGFRVYKVDTSNLEDISKQPSEYAQGSLDLFANTTKEGRSSNDLLTQVILNLGLKLDLLIEEKTICNKQVFIVEENSIVACFEDNLDENLIEEICKLSPMRIVFKESSFKTDALKLNVENKIKKLSPNTLVSII